MSVQKRRIVVTNDRPLFMDEPSTPYGTQIYSLWRWSHQVFALGTMGETPAMSAVSPFSEASGSDADIGFRPFLRFPASQVQSMFHR